MAAVLARGGASGLSAIRITACREDAGGAARADLDRSGQADLAEVVILEKRWRTSALFD